MPEQMIAASLARLRQQRTAPLILELDLTDGLTEIRPADPVSAVMARHRLVLGDVLDGLRRASRDSRVKALVIKVGGRPIGLGIVQELRQAIREFAEAGKVTVAWAESFGEFSAANVAYYLATAFDTIWLQPSGDLGLTGIAVERIFLRGTLDKLGADFQVGKRHEYKSAAEQLTEHGFSAPAREETERMTASVTEQLTSAIAERRGLDPEQVAKLIDRGPFLAGQALEAGLVDTLGYRDEVYTSARQRAGEGATLLYLTRYQRSRALAERARKLPVSREPGVALIYATGPIRRGRSGRGPLGGGAMGSDTISAALRAATADDQAKAILLRVNSPGGSYVASDTIWREVVRARAAGKPVVVSMSDVAASGGYYIAMAADVIVAQPATITGSIGVIEGKPVLGEALSRAGVSSDSIIQGAHAAMFSQLKPFTEDEWALISQHLDHIYADFTGKVAEGRRMTPERVHELARGRVWTGADAQANGLVDELGGLDQAAAIARLRAGLPERAPLRVYPRTSPVDRLRPGGSSESHGAAAASLLADGWGPAWRLAARAGLTSYGPLTLPGNWTFE
ncbi:MAG TPA: signal peptide peptidase SppA [Streptosporangiaceae bacterium]|nr:signal peptide peptidase SppA [Streptosporangiaceae bacterium]